jgi:hypothetical protein
VIETFASTLALMSALPEENEAEAFGAELYAQMSIAEKAKVANLCRGLSLIPYLNIKTKEKDEQDGSWPRCGDESIGCASKECEWKTFAGVNAGTGVDEFKGGAVGCGFCCGFWV